MIRVTVELERAIANAQAWLDRRTEILYRGDVDVILEALRAQREPRPPAAGDAPR